MPPPHTHSLTHTHTHTHTHPPDIHPKSFRKWPHPMSQDILLRTPYHLRQDVVDRFRQNVNAWWESVWWTRPAELITRFIAQWIFHKTISVRNWPRYTRQHGVNSEIVLRCWHVLPVGELLEDLTVKLGPHFYPLCVCVCVCVCGLVPRPHPAFHHLQYGKVVIYNVIDVR